MRTERCIRVDRWQHSLTEGHARHMVERTRLIQLLYSDLYFRCWFTNESDYKNSTCISSTNRGSLTSIAHGTTVPLNERLVILMTTCDNISSVSIPLSVLVPVVSSTDTFELLHVLSVHAQSPSLRRLSYNLHSQLILIDSAKENK
jgi:hypothetical protein